MCSINIPLCVFPLNVPGIRLHCGRVGYPPVWVHSRQIFCNTLAILSTRSRSRSWSRQSGDCLSAVQATNKQITNNKLTSRANQAEIGALSETEREREGDRELFVRASYQLLPGRVHTPIGAYQLAVNNCGTSMPIAYPVIVSINLRMLITC